MSETNRGTISYSLLWNCLGSSWANFCHFSLIIYSFQHQLIGWRVPLLSLTPPDLQQTNLCFDNCNLVHIIHQERRNIFFKSFSKWSRRELKLKKTKFKFFQIFSDVLSLGKNYLWSFERFCCKLFFELEECWNRNFFIVLLFFGTEITSNDGE